MNNDIKNIYISHRDRLTRLSFRTLEELFNKYRTKIIIINDSPHNSNDSEVFEELISLMHIFSTTLYSNRRKNKINIYKADIENFISDT
jgi:predicted site-specific integrase-resolvase